MYIREQVISTLAYIGLLLYCFRKMLLSGKCQSTIILLADKRKILSKQKMCSSNIVLNRPSMCGLYSVPK